MQKSKNISKYALWDKYSDGIKILNDDKIKHISKLFQTNIEKIKKFKERPLKLAVIGEFSVGKSAFLSKLLNRDGLLPEKVTPSTAFITEFYFNEKEYFEVIYENNLGDIYLEKVEDLQKLKEDEYKQNHKKNKHLSTIKKIKVYLKNDMLKSFCLLDTPGLNDSDESMSKITQEIFKEIDYAIWIFDANKAGTETEIKEITNLYENIGKSIYFLINKTDGKSEKEINKIKNHLNNLKEEYSMQDELYAISATSTEKEYQTKFINFKDNFKNKIIEKDEALSVIKIQEEIRVLIDDLSSSQEIYKTSLLEVDEILCNYKKNEIDSKEMPTSNEQSFVVEQIRKKIEDTLKNHYDKIVESDIYKSGRESELLQFYCYHSTLEVLSNIQQSIDHIYDKYMMKLLTENKNFIKALELSIEKFIIQDFQFIKNIETTISNIKSNIETSKERKILNIKGYIVGLLSDGYVYELIKDKKALKDNINGDIIEMLIQKDIDLNFIDIKIENLLQTLRDVGNRDLTELNNVIEVLNKSIEEKGN